MASFIETLRNPLKLKLFFLTKLPMAFIAGLTVKEINNQKSTVQIKYKYLTKNPFQSLYFACLAMAAELSTGILVLNEVAESKQNISTLVTGMEAQFVKKAIGTISFICEDGVLIHDTIIQAIQSQNGEVVSTKSIGKDEKGDVVAIFTINWSLKVKKK